MQQVYIDAINADPNDTFPQYVYADWLDEIGNPLGEAWRVLLDEGHKPKQEHDGTWTWLYPFAPIDKSRRPRSFWRYLTFFHAMNAAAAGWIRRHRDPEFSIRDYSKMYLGEHETFFRDTEVVMAELDADRESDDGPTLPIENL